MSFTSIWYFVFLAIVAICFYGGKSAVYKKAVLIVSSLTFLFFFNWLSAIVILFMGISNYALLKRLSIVPKEAKKGIYFTGIIFNSSILVVYKVIQVLLNKYDIQVGGGFDNDRWILLGIGFYSLQLIGYYFEVYKKRAPFEYTLPEFLLSLMFFARLPAGPILQLNESIDNNSLGAAKFNQVNLVFGIQRILLGVFKKIALADRLLPYVDSVFDKHQYINGLSIYLGPIIFTIQVYLDFSAYVDIAIGSARILGIRLPENFNLPLRASSITEFWRRWHITLVRWLTNYVFYPISYRYRKLKRKGLVIAVLCTFLLSALWHGLAITFVVWGFCHFVYIILENGLLNFFRRKGYKIRFSKIIGVVVVWHLVAFGNLFFRSTTLKDAVQLFNDFRQLPFLYSDQLSFKAWLINGGQDIQNEFNFRLSLLLCLAFLLFERKINQYGNAEEYSIVYTTLMITAIAVFGVFDTGERFIYLQF